MSRLIAVVNQKGGVAKTTTVANLGMALAQSGQRVLLVDSDPQGSLTISLGQDPDALTGQRCMRRWSWRRTVPIRT